MLWRAACKRACYNVSMNNLIQTIAVYALPLLFSITLHEAAHGYVARIFGDSTAYLLGRVSLNPLRHIDPIGTIAIPLLMYFATGGAFYLVMQNLCPLHSTNCAIPAGIACGSRLPGQAAISCKQRYGRFGALCCMRLESLSLFWF